MSVDDKIFSEQQRREFCALMIKNFGIEVSLNDEMLPVYMLAYMSAQITEKASSGLLKTSGIFEVETRKTIYEAHEKLHKTVSDFEKSTADKISRIETRQIRFGDKKQAFYYAFGSWGLPLLVGVILLFSAYFFVNYRQEQENPGLKAFIEGAKIETKFTTSGSLDILRLYPVTNMDKAIKGTHYIYNKACNCIEIPISYQVK